MKKHVGIDVSKRFFDLYVLEDRQGRQVAYTPPQVRKCVQSLARQEIALVVLEATGGYEWPLVQAFQQAGLPVAVVNPRQIRDFAKATGRLAKTDRLDARMIASYAATLHPSESRPFDPQALRLKALASRRQQLIRLRTAENNRREHALDPVIRRSIAAVLKILEQEIRQVDRHIQAQIEQQPEDLHKTRICASVPGIGDTTASMLVVEVPELGQANKKEIAALVGVAPMNRDSGAFRGKRMTGGGRRDVRARLFMPTLVAIRHNPVLRRFYHHLLEQGKAKMTAVVAAMRKLLVILNTLVKNNQMWSPKFT
jgi:transposase